MTVLPVPIAPADVPTSERVAQPAAPGFARALESAQHEGAAETPTGETAEATPSDTAPANAPDAAVMALVAALAGIGIVSTPGTEGLPATPTAVEAESPEVVATAQTFEGLVEVTGATTPVGVDTGEAIAVATDGETPEIADGVAEARTEQPVSPARADDTGMITAEDSADPVPAAVTDSSAPGATPAVDTAPTAPDASAPTDEPRDTPPAHDGQPANQSAPHTSTLTSAIVAPEGVAATPLAEQPAEDAPRPAVTAVPTTLATAPAHRAEHVMHAAPTESAAANTPPTPAEAAQQLHAVLRPLARSRDGVYQLRIELRPPELGTVHLHVELRDGVLHASIRAEHAHTADLVRNALNDLRAQLDADGVRSGDLNVDDSGTQQRERERQEASASPQPRNTPVVTMPTANADTTNSDALLDVRI
jgi:flagellar hook-length control protein FliK